MGLTTTRGAFPYPVSGDDNNPPADIQALADRMALIGVIFEAGTDAARIASTKVTGKFWWTTDTLKLWYTNGTSWYDFTDFLPLAGGTLTGNLALGFNELQDTLVRNARDKINTIGAAGASQTVAAATAGEWDLTLDQNISITLSMSDGDKMLLWITEPASVKTVTWVTTIKWSNGAAPVFVASTIYFVVLKKRGGVVYGDYASAYA